MSELSNPNLQDKAARTQLAIRRAEFIKKLKIKVKCSQKTYDQDQLILIETFNTQKNSSVELVMRKLSQLDSLIQHINSTYGGHVIPLFRYDLFYQSSLKMSQIIPAIQQYLYDLKHNKYCRQDVKFYCFIIEQHSYLPRQMGFERILSDATDISRKYLNEIFTRKNMPKERNTDILLYAQRELQTKIQQYNDVKQISLLKSKQMGIFEEVTGLFTQLSAWPSLAIEPQEHDIQYIFNTIKSCEKLIQQAKQAFTRWQSLADKVVQFQNNMYKGLHQYQSQYKQKNQQLKQWSDSLSRQFYELCEYLDDKMEALSGEVFKINSKFISMTVFAGQGIKLEGDEQQELILQIQQKVNRQNMQKQQKARRNHKQQKENGNQKQMGSQTQINLRQIQLPQIKSLNSFQIKQQIQVTPSQAPPKLQKFISNLSFQIPNMENLMKKQNSSQSPKLVYQESPTVLAMSPIIAPSQKPNFSQEGQIKIVIQKQQIVCQED